MTNEKAIQLLHRLSDEQFDGIHGDERREALEMAVRALESNLVKESGDLVQDLVKDCISRKMAIDEIRICDYGLESWQKWKLTTMLKDIPSAQPEIIRCKDCNKASKCYGDVLMRSRGGGYIYCPLEFCSKAERRTDE